MILSDGEIEEYVREGIVGLTPYDPARLNPASYDVTLAPVIRRFLRVSRLDLGNVQPGHTYEARSSRHYGGGDRIHLDPGEVVLASTVETVTLPDDLVARVEGKSSLGRLGLGIHVTAGYIDPGFTGQVTLEIKNEQPFAMLLVPGMAIGQIAFQTMSRAARRPYDQTGRYSGQQGPTESRYAIGPPRQ